MHYVTRADQSCQEVTAVCGVRLSTWLPAGMRSKSPSGPTPEELGYTFDPMLVEGCSVCEEEAHVELSRQAQSRKWFQEIREEYIRETGRTLGEDGPMTLQEKDEFNAWFLPRIGSRRS